jgi:hydrogenase maturation protease
MQTLVLGLGNFLLADEGVGVHVAQQLLEGEPREDAVVLDVGNAVLDAMPAIAAADKVVVVDAMVGGGSPGTIYRVPIEDCENSGPIGSVHGFDMQSVLHLVGRKEPLEVIVIGIEPEIIGWSIDLSDAVAEALPEVITAVQREFVS